MDATVMDEAGRHCGAEIIAIDRPGIGHSDLWNLASVGQWGHTGHLLPVVMADEILDDLAP
jgi:hypothetical protein